MLLIVANRINSPIGQKTKLSLVLQLCSEATPTHGCEGRERERRRPDGHMAASLSTRRGSVSVSVPLPLCRPSQTGLEGELSANLKFRFQLKSNLMEQFQYSIRPTGEKHTVPIVRVRTQLVKMSPKWQIINSL